MTTTHKAIGSAKARTQVKKITKRILSHVRGFTPTEAAPILGLSVDDIHNLRQGNKFSVPMLFKMVRVGRFDPVSILEGPDLCRHTKGFSTRGATQDRLDARIRKLAYTRPGKEWAKLIGLSETGAYGLRYTDAHVTLYTVLGFTHAGYSINELVFGKR